MEHLLYIGHWTKSWVYSDEKDDIVSAFMENMIQCSGSQTLESSETTGRLNKTQIASKFLIQQGWGRTWALHFYQILN